MGHQLAHKIERRGLLKSRIIFTITLAVIIVVVLVLFSFVDSGSLFAKYKNAAAEHSNKSWQVQRYTPSSADMLLSKVNQLKVGQLQTGQSQTGRLKLNLTGKQESGMANAAATMPRIVNPASETEAEEVPPITANTIKDFQQYSGVEKSFLSKRLQNQYSSYTAKTLLFNHHSDTMATTSASVVNNATPNGQQQNFMDAAVGYSSVDNNKQSESMAKSRNDYKAADYLHTQLLSAVSPYELKAGSIIPATTINGINSDIAGEVVATVRQNVYDSIRRRYLLIPQGARLVGLYDSNIIYGQSRLLVAWNRLIYPDGSSINLRAMPGTDLAGYTGFYDLVDNKYGRIFGASFIIGIITGAMQYSQNNTNNNVQVGGLGVTSSLNPTVGQTMSGSLGQQLGQTGLAITQKNLQLAPTIIIRPNYPFNIMLTADMILKEYK